MLWLTKEKSWSVKLVDGFILNDQVRAKQCRDCTSTTRLLVYNLSNPNMLLYGCSNNKCKHRLIRITVNPEPQEPTSFQNEIMVENFPTQHH